jgi:hypothetical protein
MNRFSVSIMTLQPAGIVLSVSRCRAFSVSSSPSGFPRSPARFALGAAFYVASSRENQK